MKTYFFFPKRCWNGKSLIRQQMYRLSGRLQISRAMSKGIFGTYAKVKNQFPYSQRVSKIETTLHQRRCNVITLYKRHVPAGLVVSIMFNIKFPCERTAQDREVMFRLCGYADWAALGRICPNNLIEASAWRSRYMYRSWLRILTFRVRVPLEAEFSSWTYGALMHRAFHYLSSVVLRWLRRQTHTFTGRCSVPIFVISRFISGATNFIVSITEHWIFARVMTCVL